MIMALLFLPPHEITGMFVQLEATGLLQLFANYIRNTWIDSQLWPQSCWTVFMKAVRTNSNTEPWVASCPESESGRKDTAAPIPTHSATSPGSQIDITANQASNRKEA